MTQQARSYEAWCITYQSSEQAARAAYARVVELEAQQAVQMPEPAAWLLGCQTMGGEVGWKLSFSQSGAGVCHRLNGAEHEQALYTEQQVRAMLSAPPAQKRKSLTVAYPADMTSFNARMAFKAGWQSGERAHGIGATNAD